MRKEKRTEEEILELEDKIKRGEEDIRDIESKLERRKEEGKILEEKLEKGKVILRSVSQKINSRRKREQGEEWEKELNARGWSRRAVQALGWLWENQDIERESPELELSSQEPNDGVFLLLLYLLFSGESARKKKLFIFFRVASCLMRIW